MMIIFWVLISQINLGGYQGTSLNQTAATDSLYVKIVKAWPFSFTASVATDGKRGYAATREGVYIVSTDITEPPLRATDVSVRAVRVYGGVIYAMLEGREGMSIFGGAEGEKKGVYASDANCMDMAFSGKLCFIAAGEDGMIVASLEDPLFPQDISYYDTPGYAQGIDVEGKYAAIADGEEGVYLVDISSPGSPTHVAKYNTDGVASGVDIYGKYVFVADGKGGMLVLDFSLDNPLVGQYKTTGFVKAVHVSGKYAYLADGKGGLRILDVTNLSSIVEKGYYDTPGFTGDLALAPPLVYVADGQYGVLIMENTLLKYFK